MNPFSQLSLVWQVWGAMLLGAILLGTGLFVGIEWAWLCWSARAIARAAVAWCRRTFTDPPTRPHTTGTFGQLPNVSIPAPTSETRSGTRRDADAILIAARTRADVFDIAAERHRLQLLRAISLRRRGAWTVH